MDEVEEITAYHEAGHAVMSVLMGGSVERVTIQPPDDDGIARYGETITAWPVMPLSEVWHAEICVSLAGPVAEMLYSNESIAIADVEEWAMDWQRAVMTARQIKPGVSGAKTLLNQCQSQIHHFFDQDNTWAAVSAVADELLAHQTLEAEQVADAVSFWLG